MARIVISLIDVQGTDRIGGVAMEVKRLDFDETKPPTAAEMMTDLMIDFAKTIGKMSGTNVSTDEMKPGETLEQYAVRKSEFLKRGMHAVKGQT